MASAIDVISKLQWYTLFPRLTQANLKTILSSYGYLNRDYNLNDASNYVQNISSLLPDGVLNVLWTEYPFVYPTPVLNEHPYNIKLALQAAFQANPNNFLSRLDETSVYNLLNDESQASSETKVRQLFSWSYTAGANRFLSIGNPGTTPSGGTIGWADPTNIYNSDTTSVNAAPSIGTNSQPLAVKQRLDGYPDGYKGVFLTYFAFAHYLPVSGNFSFYNQGNGTAYPANQSYAVGAPTVSYVDPFVSGILGGTSGTANYINPSGYPGIYFNDWDEQVKRCHAWFKSYKDLGGQLDYLLLDSEYDDAFHFSPFTINQRFYTGNGVNYTEPTAMAAGNKPWDAIYKDSRWSQLITDYPSMPASSDIAVMNTWTTGPTDSRTAVFSEIGLKRMSKQYNDKIFNTIKIYFPNIKLLNYEYRYKSMNTVPDLLGLRHFNCSGIGNIYGNRQSTYLYMDISSQGSETGYLYQTWTNTKNFPPVTDYAYSNGVPHSGGYLGFVNAIRKTRTSVVTSTVPFIPWVIGPLELPYYTVNGNKNIGSWATDIGAAKLGNLHYLYDEYIAHTTLNSEDLLVYNPATRGHLLNNVNDVSSKGLQYSASGNKTLYNSLTSPTGIPNLVCWYDFSDTGNMYQNNNLTGPVNAIGQSVGSVFDKSGNGYSASGLSQFIGFPTLQSGTLTRTSRAALFFNGGAGLYTPRFGQSTFSGGYTLYFCLSASGIGAANYYFGTQSSFSLGNILQNGNVLAPNIQSSFEYNNSTSYANSAIGGGGLYAPLESYPGSCRTFAISVDPRKRKPDGADVRTWVDLYCDGQQASQQYSSLSPYTYGALATGLIQGTTPTTDDRFLIGGRVFPNSNLVTSSGVVYFHEFLLFSRAITDNEARSIDGYLHNKYSPKDGNGNPTPFFIYPTRSDIKTANERITNNVLEFEGIAGQEAGAPIVISEPLFHDPSGVVSSRAVYGKIVSRFTPHPNYANSHTVISNSSGVQFNVNGQIFDFPRGVITTPANPMVSAPSGYWIVTSNRTGSDASDFNSSRLLALQSIFGSTPPDLTPPLTSNTAPAIYARPVNEIGGVVINAGNSDRFRSQSPSTVINDIIGSNPIATNDAQSAATSDPQLVNPEEGVYNISETSSSSPRRSIAYTTTARTEKQNIPTTSGINPETGEFLSQPVVQLDSFGADDAAQPTRTNPGSITFNTGSSIPRSQNYPPKSL